jgi:sulfite reductase (NADPH) hemoprotein beta-component
MGLKEFQAEVERRLGYKLQPARPFNFTNNVDEFGWVTGEDGRHHYTTFIENGRVQDEPEKNFKSGLREIAKVHKGDFKLTANQHIIISNVADSELPEIKRLLAEYKLDNVNQSGLRLSSSACVAFPTCGTFYFLQPPYESHIDVRRFLVRVQDLPWPNPNAYVARFVYLFTGP